MLKILSAIGGLGVGAALMFILDPDRGRSRRATIRDKANRAAHKTGDALGTAARDLSNRTQGIISEASSLFTKEPIDDTTLLSRIRTKLGRVSSHPQAIDVIVQQGRVIVQGPVLASEAEKVIGAISKVSGVSDVENLLDVHETADITELQGESGVASDRLDILQRNWSPATRLLVGAAGGALTVFGVQQRGILGTALGTVGLGLVTRGVTNTALTDLIRPDGQSTSGQETAAASDTEATSETPRPERKTKRRTPRTTEKAGTARTRKKAGTTRESGS
jgi:BON domain